MDTPIINVDDRQGSIELIPTLQMAAQTICTAKSAIIPRVISCRMVGGDVAFDGLGPNDKRISIGIERKRLHSKNSDMISSIRTGRFSGLQQVEMYDLYDECYLIIEGYSRCGPDGTLEVLASRSDETGPTLGGKWIPVYLGTSVIRYTELEHFIDTFNRCTRVRVLRSTTPWDTAAQIISLYTHSQKPYTEHHAHQQLHVAQTVTTIGKASFVRRVAAQLDGIGWEKSGLLDLKFNSVSDMCESMPGEFQAIKGIGKVLAQRIWDQLHGVYKSPGEL
jgi:ERCC4-type nuclease